MTRKALDMIKSIAMGEYKPVEEAKAEETSEEAAHAEGNEEKASE